jgi:hypothetical protein
MNEKRFLAIDMRTIPPMNFRDEIGGAAAR